jgi:hypothetical protein
MGRRTALALAAGLLAAGLAGPPALAQTAADGRIVRVVYALIFEGPGPRDSTWGFHLAHMKDGRYCVRFGNPGRLNLAVIQQVYDICFNSVPATVDRSQERRSESFDAREKGKRITVVSYQKGSIQASGNDITLEVATCNRVEGEQETRCFPNRYVVHMNGPACRAEVTLSGSRSRAGATTCEHYPAQ